MSTAGRATYQAAKGTAQVSAIKTAAVSGKDQTAHTKLKFRQFGQASQEELKQKKEQLKHALDEKEYKITLGNSKETKWMVSVEEEEKKVNVEEILEKKPVVTQVTFEEIQEKYDDADIDFDSVSSDASEENGDDAMGGKKQSEFDTSDEDDDDEDDDEEDDEAALQAELERIREERALAQARKEQEEKAFQERLAQEQALRSNPLLSLDSTATGKMKRRWNDDVVFRNQSKDEPDVKKRFINDTVRNDFHRSFLRRYIK